LEKAGNKKKRARTLRRILGLILGLFSWLVGFHCIEVDAQGNGHLSIKKIRKHLFKVFLWTLELTLLFHLFTEYLGWLMHASGPEKATAFLIKSVIFLYIKVFWPKVFPEILPGMHVFFCPQCYQKQTFKFMPVSFQFGNFVTYLCSYCSCLVDAWGKQIFFPTQSSFGKLASNLSKTIPLVLVAVAFGLAGFEYFWRNF